jgi:CRISPR-associated protein Csx14
MKKNINLIEAATLIATLGSEPQVVTAALDLLLARGEPLRHVIVLHTVQPDSAVNEAVARLADELTNFQGYAGLAAQLVPILDEKGRPVSDVHNEAEGRAAFRALFRQLQTAKSGMERVHLLIAGGRKTLALFGMAAAQLLFDEHDSLWHLYSAGTFLESRRLHPQASDQVQLIPVPVILWSQVSPVLTGLAAIQDPYEAMQRVRDLQINQKLEAARAFILGALTPAERRAVELLVQEGLSDQEIAGRLALSPRTVEGQLRSAYSKAAAHWELEDVSRAQLVALLSLYYQLNPGI